MSQDETVNPCEVANTCAMSNLCPGYPNCVIARDKYNNDTDEGMNLTPREVEQLETALDEPDETPFNDFHAQTYYARPDTSDKTDEETWLEYWDRKRHERHGPDCGCMLCANEDLLKEMGKSMLPPEMRGWVE